MNPISNRGNAKSALGNYQGATSDRDRAIAIDPQLALAYNNRGAAKSALDNQQRQLTISTKSDEIISNSARCHDNTCRDINADSSTQPQPKSNRSDRTTSFDGVGSSS
jgi:tetratricopeptide (TPR) repeat protein